MPLICCVQSPFLGVSGYAACVTCNPPFFVRRYIVGSNIHGRIPTEIGLLTRLQDLAIRANQFISDSIPTEIGRLTKLTTLYSPILVRSYLSDLFFSFVVVY